MRVSGNRVSMLMCGLSLLGMLAGCQLLPTMGAKKEQRQKIFFLEPQLPAPQPLTGNCGNLLVGEMVPAPGFRSARLAYTTTPLVIGYYANARWSASFGQLLESPLQIALQNTGQFAHVTSAASSATSDLRLEFSDLRLLQRFASPDADSSSLVLSVGARLLRSQPATLLESRRFEYEAAAPPNAAGGAKIANELAARLIDDISRFAVAACADHNSS